MIRRGIIFAALFVSAVASAAEAPLCPAAPIESPQLLDANNRDIVIRAEQTRIMQDTLAYFSGDVDIQSRFAQIQAQQATFHKTKRALNASGNIRYLDPQIEVTSDGLMLNANSGELSLSGTRYRLTEYPGRGDANTININADQGIQLDDVSFTTCPVGQEDWSLKAGELRLQPGEIWGEAKHTRLYIGDVPILYLPYFSFPVTDQRQSGLLFPEFTSSDRVGASYEQPIYWNIAPNYDMTFSPRIMTDRGVQLKTEFRYLTEQHQGQMNVEYIDHDRRYEEQDQSRYFYRIQHFSRLSDQWQVQADITDLSDDNYIVDLGSDYFNRADTHLYQTMSLDYFSRDLTFSALLRDFEIIGNHPSSYRTLPQLSLDYGSQLFSGFEFDLASELTYFDNPDPNKHTATRWHIEPSLTLPYRNEWSEWEAQFSVLHTRYHQDVPDESTLSRNVERTLGSARLYGGVDFERQVNFSDLTLTQTLEPRIQYLYTSYEDQSDIGLYDSNRLLNDYDGLFRGRNFVGLDRISDANHLTVGLTSRLLDDNDIERLRLSLGQIFYFETPQLDNRQASSGRSSLAGEIDWRIDQQWTFSSELQLDADDQDLERGALTLDYQADNQALVQASYRYVESIGDEEIEQLGVSGSWPISQRWHWVARWYKDVTRNRSIETYTGLQYDSCCWSVQFVAQRYLSNRFDALGIVDTDEYESGISLQFIFKGMGSRDTARGLLDEGLFGYRQPYTLNQ